MKTITIQVPDDCEVKIVKKKEEKEEPVIKTFQDLISKKGKMKGFLINVVGKIVPCTATLSGENYDTPVAASEKVAKSMLAMAMISQLIVYYGGEITEEEWNNPNMFKFCLKNDRGKIWASYEYTIRQYLAFHTAKQRDDFLKYNERLVKNYLMID